MSYTQEILKEKTVKELIEIHNSFSVKPVKRFAKKQDGINIILKLQQYEEKKEQKATSAREKSWKDIIDSRYKLTNAEFAKEQKFIQLCEQAGCEPTIRQASKFRNQRGLAYNAL